MLSEYVDLFKNWLTEDSTSFEFGFVFVFLLIKARSTYDVFPCLMPLWQTRVAPKIVENQSPFLFSPSSPPRGPPPTTLFHAHFLSKPRGQDLVLKWVSSCAPILPTTYSSRKLPSKLNFKNLALPVLILYKFLGYPCVPKGHLKGENAMSPLLLFSQIGRNCNGRGLNLRVFILQVLKFRCLRDIWMKVQVPLRLATNF